MRDRETLLRRCSPAPDRMRLIAAAAFLDVRPASEPRSSGAMRGSTPGCGGLGEPTRAEQPAGGGPRPVGGHTGKNDACPGRLDLAAAQGRVQGVHRRADAGGVGGDAEPERRHGWGRDGLPAVPVEPGALGAIRRTVGDNKVLGVVREVLGTEVELRTVAGFAAEIARAIRTLELSSSLADLEPK